MLLDPRALLFFACNTMLVYLMQMVNSALASEGLYLFLLGPLIVFPSLCLRHQSYFICTLLTGLWVDAALPTTFGFFTICFLFGGACIFQMRIRFRPEYNDHPKLLAQGLNFFYLFVLSIASGTAFWSRGDYWTQIGITCLASHGLLWIVAPWFYNFERMLLRFFNMESYPKNSSSSNID